MPKPDLAERILILVMAPERAAPIVGDLMEDAPVRGNLWFWANVLRAALAFLWLQFTADYSRLYRLALQGLAIAVVLDSAFNGLGLPWLVKTLFPHGFYQSDFRLTVIVLVMTAKQFLVPFFVGLWVAWRAAGRELAVCLSLTLAAYVGRLSFVLVWNYYFKFHLPVLELGFPYFLGGALLAAIIMRRKALPEVSSS
jgi:hypothetical protein